jgi:hypothetical protein
VAPIINAHGGAGPDAVTVEYVGERAQGPIAGKPEKITDGRGAAPNEPEIRAGASLRAEFQNCYSFGGEQAEDIDFTLRRKKDIHRRVLWIDEHVSEGPWAIPKRPHVLELAGDEIFPPSRSITLEGHEPGGHLAGGALDEHYSRSPAFSSTALSCAKERAPKFGMYRTLHQSPRSK